MMNVIHSSSEPKPSPYTHAHPNRTEIPPPSTRAQRRNEQPAMSLNPTVSCKK